MPKYIDIHAHTNFKAYDEDREEVIRRALDNDTWVINIGTQYDTSKKAVEMTNEYEEGVYATIGLHPIHTTSSYHDENKLGTEGKTFSSRGEVFDKEKYRGLSKEGKVVAIGECGLDYYHLDQESIEKQKKAFISQIELANELNLPLMLHIRNSDKNVNINAYKDTLTILKEVYNQQKKAPDTNSAMAEFVSGVKNTINNNSIAKGVIHFFAGTVEDAKDFINFGFYISFAGPITYKPNLKICDYDSVIRETPLDMILTDTDSPYVAPVPYRGQRNEPVYIKEIVKKIAEIKGIDEKEMARSIFDNAKRLFKL
jgi:TatD DNase family protein